MLLPLLLFVLLFTVSGTILSIDRADDDDESGSKSKNGNGRRSNLKLSLSGVVLPNAVADTVAVANADTDGK